MLNYVGDTDLWLLVELELYFLPREDSSVRERGRGRNGPGETRGKEGRSGRERGEKWDRDNSNGESDSFCNGRGNIVCVCVYLEFKSIVSLDSNKIFLLIISVHIFVSFLSEFSVVLEAEFFYLFIHFFIGVHFYVIYCSF